MGCNQNSCTPQQYQLVATLWYCIGYQQTCELSGYFWGVGGLYFSCKLHIYALKWDKKCTVLGVNKTRMTHGEQ